MIRTLIIDDELQSREALKNALEKYCPEVDIVDVIDCPRKGVTVIQNECPDLVFLDVQMPGMSGFDLLKKIQGFYFEVIFVTSYDHYAIKAIKFSALDYLLKPIDIEELIRAVDKTKKKIELGQRNFGYESVLNNIKYTTGKVEKLAISTQEGMDFINTDSIIYLQADGSYTNLYMINNKKQITSKSLKDFQGVLESSGFFRVHNSYLINLKHIRKYIKGEGGYVILSEDHHVDVSRRRKDNFLNVLDKI
ncbi:LytR/AlgR family response regulator transcription factor [Aquimarina pacifica]|uniref:LytR/AlgR family response regulator transcription factor n=1 Tax=Aquimarina pacifica TaxID=1296415 RepID=UPI000472B0CF|nr:LytTR family DNA-binding domain-containing protein [Aquimarina pacifica]